MKTTVHDIDPKTRECYRDTRENREAGRVRDVEVPDYDRKIVTKDGERIAQTPEMKKDRADVETAETAYDVKVNYEPTDGGAVPTDEGPAPITRAATTKKPKKNKR